MKLHLPHYLTAALLSAMASGPVYSATPSVTYENYPLDSPIELDGLQINTPTAILLFDGKDYTYDRSKTTTETVALILSFFPRCLATAPLN